VEESGFEPGEIEIEDDALKKVIRQYTYEAGVRNLEREIGRLCRKQAGLISEKKKVAPVLTEKMIEKFLGPPQFFMTEAERQDEVGVATAIAWTENGGEIMPVEVLIMDGKGNLQVTGQIGDVMQESAQAALSFVKSRAVSLKIDPKIFEEVDIHLHIPEGAIPKDGPSAGITMATALVSAFTERRVYKEIGMTGEITLRGNVLPIGGVREKILAAHRSGLKTILLPEKNEKDLVEVPKKVRGDLNIRFVKHMDEVIKIALHKEAEKTNTSLSVEKKKKRSAGK
jgi:ATP-dependent Lon protease